jgi:sugar-phosphatase
MTTSSLRSDAIDLSRDDLSVVPGSVPWDGAVFDAVLFDLDGTLVDSGAAVVRSWVAWAAENDIAPERLQGFHGMPAVQILAELVSVEHVPAAAERLEQLEVADVDDIVLLPGAARALDDIDFGRSAIVTSCTAPLAAARIAAAGVRSPAVVVTASDVEVGKPDPAPFLLAAQRLGADPARCLVVEDAVSGLTAARAAGMASLAVTTTYDAEVLDADVVVPDLDAVRFVSRPDGIQVVSVAALP